MNAMDALNTYVTIDEASRLAGVPAATLGYWIVAGVLEAKSTRQGRMVRMADVRRAAGLLDRVVDGPPVADTDSPAPPTPQRDAAWLTLLTRILDLEREVARVQVLITHQSEQAQRLVAEQGRVHERAARMDISLAEQVGRTNASLADITHRLERVEGAATEQGRELGRLDGAVGEQSAALGRLDERITRHDGQLSRHDDVLARHDSQVTRHDDLLARHDTLLERHDDLLARHDALLARLESLMSEQSSAIRRLEQRPPATVYAQPAPAAAAFPAAHAAPPVAEPVVASARASEQPALVLRLRSAKEEVSASVERQPATGSSRPQHAAPSNAAAEGSTRSRRSRWPFLNRPPARNSSVRG